MTQGQWLCFTGQNQSIYRPEHRFGDKQHTLTHPMENVSWEEVNRVLSRLGLRLPSEAEWEYAARAGTTTIWWTGNEKKSLGGAANLMDLSYKNHMGTKEASCEEWLDDGYVTHGPVDFYEPNPFGLHGLLGNVYEWCQDTWHSNYENAPSDGSPWIDPGESTRVCRDCCWDSDAESGRHARRLWRSQEYKDCGLGFRPAVSLSSFARN
jgi:formylglycine-generating enzyme required for sulfatase activity